MKTAYLKKTIINGFLICSVFSPAITSCNNNTVIEEKYAMDTSACGCKLNTEEMILECPVKAVNDKLIICKVGTNEVLGSGRGPMKWPEYMASEYNGAEGELTDCKTGKKLISDIGRYPILTYRNDQLWVDKRFELDIFDPAIGTWRENIALPVWRNIVYAVNNALHITPDSLIFKPPLISAKAFKSADSTYKWQLKMPDIYNRSVNQLLACALNGDTLSEHRLLGLDEQFKAYLDKHSTTKTFVDERINLFLAYKAFLNNGGKREYFNLSVFPYSNKQSKSGKALKRTLKPLPE